MPHTITFLEMDESDEVIFTREPKGKFISNETKCWVAIDNSTGDAWTEEFESLELAVIWLINNSE